MFALAQSALDLVWAAAADVEEFGRFRNADGLDEDRYLIYRVHVSGQVYDLMIKVAEESRGVDNLDYHAVRHAVYRQCDLMWCASLDAHGSPDFRLADGNLDYDALNRYRRNVRDPGAGEIVNAVKSPHKAAAQGQVGT